MGFCPQLGGVGPCPAQCIWQGSGFAADQTNAMLATSNGGDKISRNRKLSAPIGNNGLRRGIFHLRCRRHVLPYHSFPSLPPTKTARSAAPPPPAETASLGFGGSPGAVKNSCFAFFRHFCVGGGITTLWPLCLCRNNPARGLFQQKKRLSQSGCSAPTDTLFPPSHALFRRSCWGWYHYPRRALHAVETLDAQGSRRRIRRFYAAAVFALCGLNIPSAGTHATPAPNRAHSGSHAETRGVFTA